MDTDHEDQKVLKRLYESLNRHDQKLIAPFLTDDCEHRPHYALISPNVRPGIQVMCLKCSQVIGLIAFDEFVNNSWVKALLEQFLIDWNEIHEYIKANKESV